MAVSNTRDTLHVKIVTAERELYSGKADMVSAPGVEGRLGILPSHAALLTLLGSGDLRIKHGQGEEPLYVSEGFLEVFENTVTVLAETAEHGEEIDEAAAESARHHAQERLAQAQSDVERADLQVALERAVSRLRVAELSRRHGRRRTGMPSSE